MRQVSGFSNSTKNSTKQISTTLEGPTLISIILWIASRWAHKPKQLHINKNIVQGLLSYQVIVNGV